MVNPVKFTRDSGYLARDEFLVISEGYHMLTYCTALAGVGYFQS